MKSMVYDIAINTNQTWTDSNCLYEIARIVKKDTDDIVIRVYYCRNAYQKLGFHTSTQRINAEEICIVLDDLYIDLAITNSSAFEAMIMHEVGHLVNGDFDAEIGTNEIKRERAIEILKGKVMPNELAADRFAVEHCGKNAVMKMLDIIMSTRKKRNTADGEIAIRELELRKQAVKRI